MPTYLTQSEYASRQGWSAAYVSKLKAKARLVMSPDGRKIDVEATDALLGATADPAKVGVQERWARERGTKAPPAAEFPSDPNEKERAFVDFQVSKARREASEAIISEVNAQKALGNVVTIASVSRAGADIGAVLDSALEQLPNRLAPLLAVEQDEHRITELLLGELDGLRAEIRKTLLGLVPKIVEANA